MTFALSCILLDSRSCHARTPTQASFGASASCAFLCAVVSLSSAAQFVNLSVCLCKLSCVSLANQGVAGGAPRGRRVTKYGCCLLRFPTVNILSYSCLLPLCMMSTGIPRCCPPACGSAALCNLQRGVVLTCRSISEQSRRPRRPRTGSTRGTSVLLVSLTVASKFRTCL